MTRDYFEDTFKHLSAGDDGRRVFGGVVEAGHFTIGDIRKALEVCLADVHIYPSGDGSTFRISRVRGKGFRA